MRLSPHHAAGGLLAAFVACSSIGLGRHPTIQVDEAWIAAPGYDFWETGRFGATMFAGFAGMERHYYDFPPLFSLLQGAVLRLVGLGLPQLRLLPLLLTTLALVLVWRLSVRLLSPAHGLVALAILVSWPVTGAQHSLTMGIPMADVARIARYDTAVPVFGLAAMLLLTAEAVSVRRAFAAGALLGLATSSHLYGAAWFVALLAFVPSRRHALALASGMALFLLPYLAFVASGWQDFLDQTRAYGPRVDLSSPGFYLSNLLDEPRRWGVFGALRRGQPAAWALLVCLAAGTAALYQTRRRLLLPPIVFVALFALLLRQKNRMYLATVWPLLALVACCGLMLLLRHRLRPVRLAAAALAVGASLHGALTWRGLYARAAATTPFAELAPPLRALVPAGSDVLGPIETWPLLHGHVARYRAVNVPLMLAAPNFMREPIPFGRAADALAPDTLLLSDRLVRYLTVDDPLARATRDWVDARGSSLGTFTDRSYGQFQAWAIRSPSGPRP